MSISVYLAAPFPEQETAKRFRDALAARGIGCTSRWLHGEASLGNLPASDDVKVRFARMNRYDLRRAQAVVLWNPESYASRGTGGRHAESGMAFMLAEMPVFVVGARTNIFAWLPEAVFVPLDVREATDPRCFEAMVDVLTLKIKARCLDFGVVGDPVVMSAPDNDDYEPPRPTKVTSGGFDVPKKPETVDHPAHYGKGKDDPYECMKPETVDHPAHYGKGKDDPYECIKVLRAWGCYDNALRFNSIKYLARAGKKGDTVEDLRKSIWYINEEIAEIERLKEEESS